MSMATATIGTSGYLAAFEKFAASAPGGDGLAALRRTAINHFAEAGFPSTREEEWRFTSLAPLAKASFGLAARPENAVSADDVERAGVPGLDSFEIVLVNGWFAPALSRLKGLPKGVTVCSLAEAMVSHEAVVSGHLARHAAVAGNPFAALNTAFLNDGAFVHIARGVVLERPIEILNLAAPQGSPFMCHPRHLVVAEEMSQATILEHYEGRGDGPYFTNAVAEVALAAGAIVDYYRIQRESLPAFHIATIQVLQGRASTFTSTAVNLGAAIMRSDIGMVLDGEGAVGTLNGLYMADGNQLTDTHTRIDHAKPNCESHELYKGILSGRSRGVFNGRIIVRPLAQKTNARQTNRNLLLSPDALANTNPQLEIYADDVKCTHGATIGQLEEQALFYLRTRGIGAADARRLLTYAFANDIIRRVRIEPLRAQLEDFVLVTQGVSARPLQVGV
jgi:Fe-S cluster assembly protein SufD